MSPTPKWQKIMYPSFLHHYSMFLWPYFIFTSNLDLRENKRNVNFLKPQYISVLFKMLMILKVHIG